MSSTLLALISLEFIMGFPLSDDSFIRTIYDSAVSNMINASGVAFGAWDTFALPSTTRCWYQILKDIGWAVELYT